jgi:DNA-binding NtrC family response regulator
MTQIREFSLLFVDDDPLLHQSLKLIIPKQWRVISCQDPSLVPFDKFFHLAFVDMHLSKNSARAEGLDVIKKLSEMQPQLEIVAASGDWGRDLMEKALKNGAQKFLGKPWQVDEVHSILEKNEALWHLRNAGQSNRETVWIGESEISQNLKKTLARLKGETTPVLIEGETGTGKEVVARILHEQESERPFIAVNIAAIAENLFESEMFGHVKGAFTGADQLKIGLIEAAHGGDLFLDEIEEFPLQHQAKLLRFLESGEIKKVGAKDTQKVQTRVLAASNQPLETLVKEGKFREDLYFRLASQKIQLPPLRSRLDDVKAIAEFFLEKQKPRYNKTLTQDGIESLKKYSWPGNVRELKRVCEQLALTSPLPLIRDEDVALWTKPARTVTIGPTPEKIDFSVGLSKLVENYEASLIQRCLDLESDIEKAALRLNVSKSNLYKKIKDYNLKTKGE